MKYWNIILYEIKNYSDSLQVWESQIELESLKYSSNDLILKIQAASLRNLEDFTRYRLTKL